MTLTELLVVVLLFNIINRSETRCLGLPDRGISAPNLHAKSQFVLVKTHLVGIVVEVQ